MTRRARKIIVPLLAFVGVQFWLLILNDWGRNSHLTLLAIALGVSVISPLHRVIWALFKRLRRPSTGARMIAAAGITILSGAGFYQYALSSGRDLFPIMHDEFQFLLQARMLSAGRLWMPGHPLVDFFDTFYVLVQPKYAAQSFPGTAFFYVPAIWLHLPAWKWTVGLAGIVVGLFYLVVTELIDGWAGLLGAVMLYQLSMLRFVSTKTLAQTPLLILGLGAIWIYLRWRKSRRHRIAWVGCLGFVCGMMVVTRPADAVVFCLPIGVGFLLDLRSKKPGDSNPPALPQIALLLLAAAPWIGLQFAFDRGVTGHWLTTPFAYYNQRDQPRLVYGLSIPAGNPRPATRVPEKRLYYESLAPLLEAHKPELFWHTFVSLRLPVTIGDGLPQPMLLAMAPMGLLAFSRRRAWVLGATLPLFFLIYTPYPLFPAHYTVIAAPAAILMVLLGAKAIGLAWPGARGGVWSAMAVFVVGLLFTRSVDCLQMTGAMALHPDVLKAANDRTAEIAAKGKPAVVLFRRSEQVPLDYEPVYNLDAVWPDDELVIRAHDRRGDNWRIFQYYAQHGPDRAFYLLDEGRPGAVRFLGMASDLARTRAGQSLPSPR